jgi:Uncharacterized conserved protein
MQSITIIGVGRVGGALGVALERAGYTIDQFVVRRKDAEPAASNVQTWENLDGIESDYIFITTQDSEIADAARRLKLFIRNAAFVFHTSGSLSSSILDDLKTVGCRIGSMHPLVSISDPLRGAEKFANSYFCLEGDPDAIAAAETVVSDLGGKWFSIDTK